MLRGTSGVGISCVGSARFERSPAGAEADPAMASVTRTEKIRGAALGTRRDQHATCRAVASAARQLAVARGVPAGANLPPKVLVGVDVVETVTERKRRLD